MRTKDNAFDTLVTFKCRNVEATIWRDESAPSGFVVKLARVYWADDELKASMLYSEEELLQILRVAADAYAWIAARAGTGNLQTGGKQDGGGYGA